MRVTFVNRMMGILRGGGEYFDLYMADALQKLGLKIRFVVGRRYRRLDEPVEGFETHYIKTPYLRGIDYRYGNSNYGALRVLSRRTRFWDNRLFEVMASKHISHIKRDDIYQICGLSYLGARLTKLGMKSVICWPGPPQKRDADCSRQCAGTFSYGTSYECAKKFLPEVEYIVAGCNTSLFTPPKNRSYDKGKCKFVFVGRFVPPKNLDYLVEGFARAKKLRPWIRLCVVGDGQLLPVIKTKVRNLNLADSVEFPGFQKEQALASLYQEADCFTLVSHYESFGIVVLEAMSSGLPVILSNVGNLPYFIKKFRAGTLVSPGNVEELCNTIVWWADHPEERAIVGRKNRQAIVDNFSWETSAKKLIAFYKRLLDH